MLHMILVDLETGAKVEARGVDDVAAAMRKSLAMYDSMRTAIREMKDAGETQEVIAQQLKAQADADKSIPTWTAEKDVRLKRNKQVDVPTEAWQKNVERRLKELELLLSASEYPDARYGRKWETNFGTVEIPGHIIASGEKYEHPKVKVARLQMELDSGEGNVENAKHRLEIAKRDASRFE